MTGRYELRRSHAPIEDSPLKSPVSVRMRRSTRKVDTYQYNPSMKLFSDEIEEQQEASNTGNPSADMALSPSMLQKFSKMTTNTPTRKYNTRSSTKHRPDPFVMQQLDSPKSTRTRSCRKLDLQTVKQSTLKKDLAQVSSSVFLTAEASLTSTTSVSTPPRNGPVAGQSQPSSLNTSSKKPFVSDMKDNVFEVPISPAARVPTDIKQSVPNAKLTVHLGRLTNKYTSEKYQFDLYEDSEEKLSDALDASGDRDEIMAEDLDPTQDKENVAGQLEATRTHTENEIVSQVSRKAFDEIPVEKFKAYKEIMEKEANETSNEESIIHATSGNEVNPSQQLVMSPRQLERRSYMSEQAKKITQLRASKKVLFPQMPLPSVAELANSPSTPAKIPPPRPSHGAWPGAKPAKRLLFPCPSSTTPNTPGLIPPGTDDNNQSETPSAFRNLRKDMGIAPWNSPLTPHASEPITPDLTQVIHGIQQFNNAMCLRPRPTKAPALFAFEQPSTVTYATSHSTRKRRKIKQVS